MVAIQRFSVLRLIDVAFWLYREHFVVLALIGCVVALPGALMTAGAQLVLQHVRAAPTGALGDLVAGVPVSTEALRHLLAAGALVVGAALFLLVVSFIVGTLATAAATRVTSLAALGEEPTLRDAWTHARGTLGGVLNASLTGALATALAFLLLVVPGFVVATGVAFIAPVIVLERVGPAEALARSWQLSAGRRWKVLAVMVCLAAVVLGGRVAVLAISEAMGAAGGNLMLRFALGLGADLAVALISPVLYVAVVLLYYDARVDREGFGPESLTRLALPARA